MHAITTCTRRNRQVYEDPACEFFNLDGGEMRLEFPEGYHVEPMPEKKKISLNGKDFTRSEYLTLVAFAPGETISEHAHRLAKRLGIGCVTNNDRLTKEQS